MNFNSLWSLGNLRKTISIQTIGTWSVLKLILCFYATLTHALSKHLSSLHAHLINLWSNSHSLFSFSREVNKKSIGSSSSTVSALGLGGWLSRLFVFFFLHHSESSGGFKFLMSLWASQHFFLSLLSASAPLIITSTLSCDPLLLFVWLPGDKALVLVFQRVKEQQQLTKPQPIVVVLVIWICSQFSDEQKFSVCYSPLWSSSSVISSSHQHNDGFPHHRDSWLNLISQNPCCCNQCMWEA